MLEASIRFGKSSDVALQGDEFPGMKSKGENPVCGQADEAGAAREGGWLHTGHRSVPVLCCCVVVLGRVSPALPALTTPNKGPC